MAGRDLWTLLRGLVTESGGGGSGEVDGCREGTGVGALGKFSRRDVVLRRGATIQAWAEAGAIVTGACALGHWIHSTTHRVLGTTGQASTREAWGRYNENGGRLGITKTGDD